jgi:hypothetical protein
MSLRPLIRLDSHPYDRGRRGALRVWGRLAGFLAPLPPLHFRPYHLAVAEALGFGAIASSGLVLGSLVGTKVKIPERVLPFLPASASVWREGGSSP